MTTTNDMWPPRRTTFAMSSITINMLPIGMLILLFVAKKHQKFIQFFGIGLLIVLYLVIFFILLLTEYLASDLTSINCKTNPWGPDASSLTHSVFNKFCLRKVSAINFGAGTDETTPRGEGLTIGYDGILLCLFLQGIFLMVPLYRFLRADWFITIVKLQDALRPQEGLSLTAENSKIERAGRSIAELFTTKFHGRSIIMFEISSLLATLGMVVLNGWYFQKDSSISWATWTFGWRAFKSFGWTWDEGEHENLFPSVFSCPSPFSRMIHNIDVGNVTLGPYYNCELQLMQVLQYFFVVYWALLVLHAVGFMTRCVGRIFLLTSSTVRKSWLDIDLLPFCQNDQDKLTLLRDYLSMTHSRYVLITSMIQLNDEKYVHEVLATLLKIIRGPTVTEKAKAKRALTDFPLNAETVKGLESV